MDGNNSLVSYKNSKENSSNSPQPKNDQSLQSKAIKVNSSRRKSIQSKVESDELSNYSVHVQSNDNNEVDSKLSNLRQKIDSLINNSYIKRTLDVLTLLFSCFIFITYVVLTYFDTEEFKWFDYANFTVAILFNLRTLLFLYLAQHRDQYLLQICTLLELYTSIIPLFFFVKKMKKIIETARIFTLYRVSNYLQMNLKINENEVVKHIVSMVIKFLTIILVITCLFRIVEIDNINSYIINPESRYDSLKSQTKFHHFLYYVIVTMSTVGYGDIYPLKESGRIIINFLIFFTAYMIPKETGILYTLLENTSVYAREIYKSTLEIPHLVICGNVSVDSLRNFCDELFHTDHGQSEKNVIILSKGIPSQEMRVFLHAGKYQVNLKYLEGNPMIEADLDRADIKKAKVTVIMADKYSADPHSTDHRNILNALAIKKYFLKKKVYDSTLFIQIIKPENKIHYLNGLQSMSLNEKVSMDRIVIIEEIKMNLLSKSCLMPGIIPFVANLVRSSGSEEETEYNWLNEYIEGSGMEIYRTTLNEKFKNNNFAQISKEIYKLYDAIAFALEIEIDGKTMITLNPGSFFIEKLHEKRNDVLFFIYVICSDKEVADKIASADFLPDSKDEGSDENDNKDDDNDDDKNDNDDNENDNNIESNQNNITNINNDDSNNLRVSLVKSKTISKFQQYMRLNLRDIMQLEENSYYYKENSEDNDYFFIKGGELSHNIKKDSIRNSTIYKNHIVVCGIHPSLYYYLQPLRAKYLGKSNLKYVVILTQDMPKELWDSISRFENLILINGSPLSAEDLYRANIEYASIAVILESEDTLSRSLDDKMIDSERVFIYKAIKKCNPKIQILTELVFQSTIEYMLPLEELSRMDPNNIEYGRTSVFSSGEVFISSIIDSLTCQAYYNKHIVTIIHQLLTGSKDSINVAIRHICENIGLKSSNFWQSEIPEKFINKTFGDLYDEFCNLNLVALGLYRLPGARDNTTAYVYTKPNPNTILTHRDRVFVLSTHNINKYFPSDFIQEEDALNDLKKKKEDVGGIEFAKGGFNNEFSPFKHIEDMVGEVERQIENLENLVNNTRNNIRESVSTGVKQEIISLLH